MWVLSGGSVGVHWIVSVAGSLCRVSRAGTRGVRRSWNSWVGVWLLVSSGERDAESIESGGQRCGPRPVPIEAKGGGPRTDHDPAGGVQDLVAETFRLGPKPGGPSTRRESSSSTARITWRRRRPAERRPRRPPARCSTSGRRRHRSLRNVSHRLLVQPGSKSRPPTRLRSRRPVRHR